MPRGTEIRNPDPRPRDNVPGVVYKQKGSKYWWYQFVWQGERIRKSTKQANRRVAEQIEAAAKTALAKGEVGIQDRKPVPTLREFAVEFDKAIADQCADKPRTVEFYREKLSKLLASSLAGRKLNAIDEAAIEKYRQQRTATQSRRKQPMSRGSINRELATLRRMLRLAHEWKLIARVPRVKLLGGEKHRVFVLARNQEAAYLSALPHPLCDVAPVLLDTGLRVGELISLDWAQVRLDPVQGARFGFLTVLYGKAKNKKSRHVPLSPRAVEILKRWGPQAKGLVFHREDGQPLPATLLDQQHARVRESEDFVLHSLRHTFGTRLGEAGADAFTIMRLMGHSSVTVSQRYVHPSPEAVELAFGRMVEVSGSHNPAIVEESGPDAVV